MLRVFSLTIVLFIFWLLLSGHYEPLFYAYGLGSCLFVVAVCYRMGIIDEEGHPIHLLFRMVTYFPWLFIEIIKSNFHVAKVILDYRTPIDPKVIKVKAGQKTDIGKVIYANSITLTPGTVTMDIKKDMIKVHALTKDTKEGVEEGEMDRRVCKLEGIA